MAADHNVSHGDILHKVGQMEGKLDALIISVSEKRSDLGEAFKRITELEKRVAQGVIVTVVIALFAPLVWQSIGSRLHFGEPPAEASSHDQRTGTHP